MNAAIQALDEAIKGAERSLEEWGDVAERKRKEVEQLEQLLAFESRAHKYLKDLREARALLASALGER